MQKRCNKMRKKMVCMIMTMFVFLFAIPVTTYASGWVEKRTDNIYDGGTPSDTSDMYDEDAEPNFIEKVWGDWFYNFGNGLHKIFTNSAVNLSLDGVVMGRLASGTDVSYVQFDLSSGNPWGTIGAYVYRFLRSTVYGGLLIWFLWQIVNVIRKRTSAKDRAEFKEMLGNLVVFVVVLAVFHKGVDYVIYFRDVITYSASSYVRSQLSLGSGVSVSVVQAFKDLYLEERSFINGFLYMASCSAGVFFFFDYVGTAIIEFGFFSGSPFIFMKSIKDKRAFTTWASTFFPNLFIPLIDSVLLLVPMAVQRVFELNVGNDSARSLPIFIIQLACIWAIVPSRNAILRGVCGYTGIPAPKSGMGGLVALGAMAMRSLGSLGAKAVGGKGSNGNEKGSDFQNAREAREQSVDFNEANKMTKNGMSDIDEMMKEDGGAQSRSSMSSDMSENGFDQGVDATNEFIDSDTPAEAGLDDTGIGIDGMYDSGTEAELSYAADGDAVAGDFEPRLDMDPDGVSGEPVYDTVDGSLGESMATLNDIDSSVAPSAAGGYRNIPGMDDEFAHSLEGADIDRYANLNARDAMTDEVTRNMSRMSDINEDIAVGQKKIDNYRAENTSLEGKNAELQMSNSSMERSIERLSARNDAIDKEIASISGGSSRPGDMYLKNSAGSYSNSRIDTLNAEKQQNMAEISAARSRMEQNNATMQANRRQMETNNNNISQITAQHQDYRTESAKLQSRNQKLQAGIDNCTSRERQYAANYGSAGMSNRVYDSAENFRITKTYEKNMAQHMNYKNFDSGRFDAFLTPEQRAEYSHQRAMRSIPKKVVEVGAKTAVAGAAGVAAVTVATAATYGGPNAMLTGGMVGGTVVGTAGDGAVKTVKKGVQVVQKAPAAVNEAKITATRAKGAIKKKTNLPNGTSQRKDVVPNKERKIQSGHPSQKHHSEATRKVNRSVTEGADLQKRFEQDVAQNDRNFYEQKGNQ